MCLKEWIMEADHVIWLYYRREADYLGVESDYNTDKLKNIGFISKDAKPVHTPVINELLLSLECELVHTVTVGSHMQLTVR